MFILTNQNLMADFPILWPGRHNSIHHDVDNDEGDWITLPGNLYNNFKLSIKRARVGQMGRAKKSMRM